MIMVKDVQFQCLKVMVTKLPLVIKKNGLDELNLTLGK